jgi:hypothetical protein
VIKVYNGLGQLVKSYGSPGYPNATMEVSDLAKGLYFVEALDAEQRIHRRKLIVD